MERRLEEIPLVDSGIREKLELYCKMLDDGEIPPVDIGLISDATKYFFQFSKDERDVFHRYNKWVVVNRHKVNDIVEKSIRGNGKGSEV